MSKISLKRRERYFQKTKGNIRKTISTVVVPDGSPESDCQRHLRRLPAGTVLLHLRPSFPGGVSFVLPVVQSGRDFSSMCIFDGVVSNQLSTIALHVVTV